VTIKKLITRLNHISDTINVYCPPDAGTIALDLGDEGRPFEVVVDMAGENEIGERYRDMLAEMLSERRVAFKLETQPGRRVSDSERYFRFVTPTFVIKIAGMLTPEMLRIYRTAPAEPETPDEAEAMAEFEAEHPSGTSGQAGDPDRGNG
jgi:hypothetical protein